MNTRSRIIGLCLAAGLLAVGVAAAAKTNYVSATGTQTVPPFTSWAQATSNLQAAITDTVAGDTVLVTNGTSWIDSEIAIANAITVKSVPDAPKPIVSRIAVGTALPQHRIFNITAAATLDGFVIRNGCLPDSTSKGAGIYMTAGTVQNCVIYTNQLSSTGYGAQGAGVYMLGGTLRQSTIVSNATASGNTGIGGGVAMGGASLLHSNTIAYNYAGADAGGVYMNHASAMVRYCTIEHNTKTGVFMSDGTVSNCVIRLNSGNQGGGVYFNNGTITDCAIVSNTATHASAGGGGIWASQNYFDKTFKRCTISGNVNNGGAGIYIVPGNSSAYGSYDFENCRITDNVGTHSIYIKETAGVGLKTWVRFRNCTIAANQPYGIRIDGGLVTNIFSGGKLVYPLFQNTIIYNFTTDIYCTTATVLTNMLANSFTNSCSPQLTAPGFNNVTADPAFVAPAAWDYRLKGASPCANAGTTNVLSIYKTDLENVAWDATVNIGCYKTLVFPQGTAILIR